MQNLNVTHSILERETGPAVSENLLNLVSKGFGVVGLIEEQYLW